MKFLDPGGCMAENRNSPGKQAEKTFIRSEECWEEPCGAQFSTQVNLARDNNESEEAVAAIGSAPQERSLSSQEVEENDVFQYFSNKNVLKEMESTNGKILVPDKGLAAETFSGCEVRVHSASCSETHGREPADLEKRIARIENFQKHVVEVLKCLRNDLYQSKINHDQVGLVWSELHRINAKINGLLAEEMPVRIRNELEGLVKGMELNQSEIQISKHRIEAHEIMICQLTEKINMLFVPYGPRAVQGIHE